MSEHSHPCELCTDYGYCDWFKTCNLAAPATNPNPNPEIETGTEDA